MQLFGLKAALAEQLKHGCIDNGGGEGEESISRTRHEAAVDLATDHRLARTGDIPSKGAARHPRRFGLRAASYSRGDCESPEIMRKQCPRNKKDYWIGCQIARDLMAKDDVFVLSRLAFRRRDGCSDKLGPFEAPAFPAEILISKNNRERREEEEAFVAIRMANWILEMWFDATKTTLCWVDNKRRLGSENSSWS
ncbi:hypothetical protein L596_023423 [Steinernema carpocapsae]|uniref:Uncharacterized protein n=1 Tax=Steinernema carpocapsae TaxID=34508 RepID=A0A4U5MDL1_STECR|nr:hypothetical protein L596_023423 [Steinernema carpocapsae]